MLELHLWFVLVSGIVIFHEISWIYHYPLYYVECSIVPQPECFGDFGKRYLEQVPNIFSQMVVNDGDESHGTIRKNHQLNKSKT